MKVYFFSSILLSLALSLQAQQHSTKAVFSTATMENTPPNINLWSLGFRGLLERMSLGVYCTTTADQDNYSANNIAGARRLWEIINF